MTGIHARVEAQTTRVASSFRDAAWRAVKRIGADELTDRAAALTYYAILGVFPALIVLVALIGLVGEHPRTTNSLLEIVDQVGPASATDTFRGPIENVVRAKGGAGALLGAGLAGALFSASGYIGAFTRTANAVYGVGEGRPFWKLRPLQILLTLAGVLLVAVVAIALVVTGPLADAIGDQVGAGEDAVAIWSVAKWPVLAVVVTGMFTALYRLAPNVRQPRRRLVSAGALVALGLWILASAAFAFYVANFGSYDATYGTLGGVVAFLVWVWITNLALLLGVELDSELERGRQLEAGVPAAEDQLQLVAREPAEPVEQA